MHEAEYQRLTQKIGRFKNAFNSMLDKIASQPKHVKVLIWEKRKKEYVVDIARMESRIEADKLEKEISSGVTINVPTKKFAVTAPEDVKVEGDK